ncbi:UNVERIFIED_CONTAM: hypothetical protein PYX00_002828 [Menopon gallinae]|uniref:Uncharacterized protein n=1 Tax=Menopon gallinae TaxID=328185 RepID=A0AAW2HYN3_9NEOP
MNKGLLSDILMNVKKDPKVLTQLRTYINEASKSNTPQLVSRKMIEAMRNIVSTCTAKDRPDPESLSIMLDTLYFIVSRNRDESTWTKYGFEVWNVILNLLAGIERTDKFQIFFCKLLISIRMICVCNTSTWRQVARPLLNVFINKKLDHNYLERSLKEFKNISKCGDDIEITNFTRQNLHLLQTFSMLARRVGDFLTQMDILELVFLYVGDDRSLMKGFFTSGNQELSEILEKLDFGHFEKDSRLFLNTLNISLGKRKKEYSPSTDSKRITISCADFADAETQFVILQLPLVEVQTLKLEFGKISGENCHCITITIDKLTEMYRFTNGQTVICTALSEKNTSEEIRNFIRMAEELSGKIQEHHKKDSSASSAPQRKYRFSSTSPMLISISDRNQSLKNIKQMSRASPLYLSLSGAEKSRVKTYSSLKDKGESENEKNPSTSGNLQVYQISSSCFGSQRQSFNCSLYSSSSSCMSLNKSRMDNSFGVLKSIENLNVKPKNQELCTNIKGNDVPGFEDNREQRLRNYSRQIYEEWASSCEDFIETQEFPMPDKKLTNNQSIQASKREKRQIPIWRGSEKKSTKKLRQTEWLSRNKQLTGRWRSEEITNTSLLDPNGYSYRRWKMETHSERGKFWLDKLKETEKDVARVEKDVFVFTEEELTDDSNVFQKPEKVKKAGTGVIKGKQSSKIRGQSKKKGPRAKAAGKASASSDRLKSARTMKAERRESTDQERKNEERVSKKVVNQESPVSVCSEHSVKLDSVIIHSRSEHEEESIEQDNILDSSSITKGVRGNRRKKSPDVFGKMSGENTIEKIVDDIIEKVSKCMDQYLQEMRKQEVDGISNFLTIMKAKINRLNKKREECEERQVRFEKCVEFFREGCSQAELHGKYQAKFKRMKEELNALKEDSCNVEKKINTFIDRLKDVIMKESESIIDKCLKKVKLDYMEQYLSNYRKQETF